MSGTVQYDQSLTFKEALVYTVIGIFYLLSDIYVIDAVIFEPFRASHQSLNPK